MLKHFYEKLTSLAPVTFSIDDVKNAYQFAYPLEAAKVAMGVAFMINNPMIVGEEGALSIDRLLIDCSIN